MDEHLVIFGTITFLEKRTDGVDKAIVYQIDSRKMLTEAEAERIIESGLFDSYLIPDIYNGDIEYKTNK
jgi:hypothetical protein